MSWSFFLVISILLERKWTFFVVVGLTGFSFLLIDHRGINIKTKRKKERSDALKCLLY